MSLRKIIFLQWGKKVSKIPEYRTIKMKRAIAFEKKNEKEKQNKQKI